MLGLLTCCATHVLATLVASGVALFPWRGLPRHTCTPVATTACTPGLPPPAFCVTWFSQHLSRCTHVATSTHAQRQNVGAFAYKSVHAALLVYYNQLRVCLLHRSRGPPQPHTGCRSCLRPLGASAALSGRCAGNTGFGMRMPQPALRSTATSCMVTWRSRVTLLNSRACAHMLFTAWKVPP